MDSEVTGKIAKEEFEGVKIEDVAVAAMFSALGAVVPQIVKEGPARWLACFTIGTCFGAYCTQEALGIRNKKEDK